MKGFTTGFFARALAKVFPSVNERKVRYAIKKKWIPAIENPFTENGWDRIPEDWVRNEMPGKLKLTPEQKRIVFEDLGINFNQLSLFSAV